MKNFAKLLKISGFLLALVLASCAHQEGEPLEGAEALYKEAEESYKDERYLAAIEKYKELKNRYPYSQKAIESELRIADCYFSQENYIEAESAYEVFRELHPSYPRNDYVQYQIGLSYFNLIPDVPSRDLSAAYRAMDAFQVLIQKYATSIYIDKAKGHIEEARKRLAEYENYVANFYYDRRYYLSATYRYDALLKNYQKYGFDDEALYKMGDSFFQIQMYENAHKALSELVEKHPASQYVRQAQDLIKQIP